MVIYKGGPCNVLLCPRCKNVDKELATEDTYFKCFECGITGDIKTFIVVDIDWDTPDGYKEVQN